MSYILNFNSFLVYFCVRCEDHWLLCDCPLAQHHLLRRLSFRHRMFMLASRARGHWQQVSGFICGLFTLFHWFISLFLCQCHTVFVTVALLYCPQYGRVMPPASFFFLRIALAVLGLLWFYISFRIICSSSVEIVTGNLIGIALNQ